MIGYMSEGGHIISDGKITTIGYVTGTVISFEIPDNTGVLVNVNIIGRDIANNSIVVFKKAVSFKCINNIATVVGGTSILTHKDSGYNTAAIMEAVNAGSLSFNVTGVSGKTISWAAIMFIIKC